MASRSVIAISALLVLGAVACATYDEAQKPTMPLDGESSSSSGEESSPEKTLPVTPPPRNAEEAPATNWRRLADETHSFVVGHLLTPSGSYRTTPAEDRTDQWHDVSQIGADVEMVKLGDLQYAPYVDATFAFMGKLWDGSNAAGGYFATSRADGSNVETSTKYVDDNALAGVTWLDAHDVFADAARKQAFLTSAKSVANWLMQSGVWDTTYGGGFWWSTQKPDKPTQSNALALRLFTRLATLTGEAYYRDWSNSVLAWLDGRMFDSAKGLYSWKMEASGRNESKFTYDQAIVIDALIDLGQVARAQKVAEAMHAVLWDAANGGYVISTEDKRLSPVFSAWASVSLVRLFEADGDPKWLERAKANMTALDAKLRDATHFGYYATSKPDGSERSSDLQAVDQSWMQRAQAALARHR